jgi:release factor glutamine methyltransferase
LSKTVLHEPHVALFGGGDGLRDLAGVLESATPRLAPDAPLVMEFGLGQEDAVRELATSRGFHVERVLEDLQGIARTIVLRRR